MKRRDWELNIEKIIDLIISLISVHATITFVRREQEYLRELEKLNNRLFLTRISLLLVTITFGGFVIW